MSITLREPTEVDRHRTMTRHQGFVLLRAFGRTTEERVACQRYLGEINLHRGAEQRLARTVESRRVEEAAGAMMCDNDHDGNG